MSPESITFIITSTVGVLTLLVTNYFSNNKLKITLEENRLEQVRLEEHKLTELKLLREQARLDREQDRLDRIADRNIIISAGDNRRNEIVEQVKQVKTVALKSALKSEQAITAANNLTEKTNSTLELANTSVDIAKQALDKVNNPNA